MNEPPYPQMIYPADPKYIGEYQRLLLGQKKSYRLFVRLLGMIGLFMPFIFQMNYLGMGGKGIFNPMQLSQGVIIVLVLPLLLTRGIKRSRLTSIALLPIIAFTLMNLFLIIRGQVLGVTHARYDMIASIKIGYWCLLWLLTIEHLNDIKSINFVQRMFAYGAAINSAIVIFFFFTGRSRVNNYLHEGVQASFGAEGSSGKAMIGFMLCAVIVAPSLKFFKSKFLGSVFTATILLGIAITNDRSGQLAFVTAVGWITFWLFSYSSRHTTRSVYIRMIFAVAIMGVVYFSQVGLDNLISRWDDLATENAGSSRLRMWQGAWLHFKNSDLTTILFGGCQDNVRNAMIAYLGADIHTHSDLFDQMLSNGLVGISVLALFFFALFKISLSINHRSFHFAIAFALFGMLLICSILTSQILYTHSMLAYVVLITCQYKLGQQDRMLRK